MYTSAGFVEIFASAGAPSPTVIELPSGASLFTAERPG
jgi:hypothetical protein